MLSLKVAFIVDWMLCCDAHSVQGKFYCALGNADPRLCLICLIQKYVQTLIRAAKSPARRLAALKCMSALLDAAPHFNYRDSMLKAMVPRMMSFDDEIWFVPTTIPYGLKLVER